MSSDHEGLRALGVALNRLRLRIQGDVHLVRLSGKAEADWLKTSGRKLRSWGIGMTVVGALVTSVGLAMIFPALQGPRDLGSALVVGIGMWPTIGGSLSLITGVALWSAGAQRLSRARELDFQNPPDALAREGAWPFLLTCRSGPRPWARQYTLFSLTLRF